MLIAILILVLLLILCVLYLLALCANRKPKDFYGFEKYLYAHRGLHNAKIGVPENSLLAFRLAVENGYGAELDVHLSRDGKLVVMHDESLLRTAGVDKNICDCTAAELNEMRLEGTEEKIPYLQEVLEIFRGKTPLIIELKAVHKNHAALTRKVCALLRRYPDVKFCMESFDPRVLMWLRKNQPKIIRGQLSCDFSREDTEVKGVLSVILTNLLLNFITVPHFVAYKFEDRKNFSLRLCKALWGVQEVNWTIRSEADAKTSLEEGSLIIFEHCRPEALEM